MRDINQKIIKFNYEKNLIMMIFIFQKATNIYLIFWKVGLSGKKIL